MLERLRWAVARALSVRRAVRCRGVLFTLSCENPITHYRWKSFESKEPETLDWIDRHVRDGDTFFDVGANIGLYSLFAARRHPRLRVLAFEPECANLHLLRDNVVHNGLQNRIELYALGLGERSGLARLNLQDYTPGSALHIESEHVLEKTAYGQRVIGWEGIWTIRLDDFCLAREICPNAIKIDVDGTEDKILLGARETLTRPELRTVLIEAGTDQNDSCQQLLTNAGFHQVLKRHANEVWIRKTAAAS